MSTDEPGWLRSADSDTETVTGVYDDWAASYDRDLADWGYRMPEVVAEAVVAAGVGTGPILDVGCGTGLVGRALQARGVSSVIGLDVSARSLELARATGAYGEVREADVANAPIPVADDHAGGLSCAGVMTYLPDTAAVVAEFARVVGPGGPIVFTQRADLWAERDDEAVLDRLAADGVCRIDRISGPHEYLPGNEEMRDIPVMLVELRAP